MSENTWTQKHLLGLEHLDRDQIWIIFSLAKQIKQRMAEGEKKFDVLDGICVGNLFFEASTRTRTSFSLAAKRLRADTVDFSGSGSSLVKGETFIDTARNIEAMGVEIVVVRHATPGASHLLAENIGASVINAGDGAHEHPTQGLLDLFTIWERKDSLEGLTVALVGDIAHSRVARSNIWGLRTLGAHVVICGPTTLVSRRWLDFGVEVCHDLDAILPRCDVLNLLRIQFERQRTGLFPSIHEYAHLFGVNRERMECAKDNVLILAPGPINRGVEVTPDVADGSHSVILDQVTNGLAIRMAVLTLVSGRCL